MTQKKGLISQSPLTGFFYNLLLRTTSGLCFRQELKFDKKLGMACLNPFTQVYVSNIMKVYVLLSKPYCLNPFTQVYVSNRIGFQFGGVVNES